MHPRAKLAALLCVGALAACRHPSKSGSESPGGREAPSAGMPPASGAPVSAPVAVAPPSAGAGAPTCAPDIPDLVAKVRPGVVNITTIQEIRGPRAGDFGFFFGGGPNGRRHPFGDRVEKRAALGTGFIIDSAGHVVTNAHVVEGADEVKIRLGDERNFSAKVKGRDSKLDIAVLEIQGAKDLPSVALGSSEQLRVGEQVVAIGNPFGLGDTVTTGIVSAKSRTIGAGPYDDFIQTDASINPGNSGGPLFNLRGQVVGINTAINPNGQGIGFAIPIDDVRQVIPQLLETGHVARGRLGVIIQPVDSSIAKAVGLDRPQGAMVVEVEPSGPAANAGIRSGDVILSVDNTPIANSVEMPRVVASHAPGSTVEVRLLRDRSEQTVRVVLDALEEKDTREPTSRGGTPGGSSHGLGIAIGDSPNGVVVTDVASGGPSDGELVPGDVIVEVDRKPVARARDVAAAVEKIPAGQPVMIKILRQGTAQYVAIERR